MTRLAVLDDAIPAQIRESPGALDGIELVWSGTDPEQLRSGLSKLEADVLILNIDHLPDDPAEWQTRLLDESQAQLVLSIYKFARRDMVQRLSGDRIRAVKAPVSLDRLRMQMMSLIVRRMLAPDDASVPEHKTDPPAPARAKRPPTPVDDGALAPPPVFTPKQLGRLQEIQSTVNCECPNHLAELIQSLSAFEAYSAHCENRDDEDAAMHHTLYLASGRARAVMEEALTRLVRHEGIAL